MEELNEIGKEAFNKQDYKESIQYYSEAIKLNPNDHNLYHSRSIAYDKLSEFNDSLIDAEKTISLKKDWPNGYFIKGNALEHLKKYDEAINTYIEGLRYDANDESLINALKNVFISKDKFNNLMYMFKTKINLI